MLQDYFDIKNWTDLTKELARTILSILVRQASARQKITYGDLGEDVLPSEIRATPLLFSFRLF